MIQLLNHVFGLLNRARFRQFKKTINYSDTHFQLNQTPPLEVLSSRSRISQTLSVFSIKFTRVESWNSSIHTVLALATSFNLIFHNTNFDWCMYSRTRDLIEYMETLSSRACIEKTDISQVINKQQLLSSVTLLERYAYDIYGTFFPCLNTREVGKFLEIYANPQLRVGFAQLYQILLTSSRVQMRVCKKAS